MSTNILETLADRRMFVTVIKVARTNGKVDKIPFNIAREKRISAHDAKNWLTPAEAERRLKDAGPEYGIGIVLTPEAKIACIDIDGAWDGAQWSPLAQELCRTFHGCYYEVSQSHRGLHLFFSYTGEFPAHSCKNVPLHIELYHEKRFILLTGINAAGNALEDRTAEAASTVAQYFQPTTDPTFLDVGWTDEPIWKAAPAVRILDDDFILRFRGNKSVSAWFGKGQNASNEAVWTGNTYELAPHFPSETGQGYDASSVDESLAVRLLWWTGGNCERVYRLMHESDLVREKWKREDYLPRTILKALKFVSANPPKRQSGAEPIPAPSQ